MLRTYTKKIGGLPRAILSGSGFVFSVRGPPGARVVSTSRVLDLEHLCAGGASDHITCRANGVDKGTYPRSPNICVQYGCRRRA